MGGPDSAPDGHAIIDIARRNIIKDLLRSYSVFIDGTLVGRFRAFGSGRYAVAPGHHEICLRVGRRTMAVSPQVELDVDAGDVRNFRTGSKRLVFSWRSFLSRTPEWEEGPWITLKPWPSSPGPVSERSEERSGGRRGPPAPEPGPVRIGDVTFRKRMRGYNIDEVDRFLGELSARMQMGEAVSRSQLSEVTFNQALKGYDIGEVDGYLATLAKVVRP